MTPSQQRLIHIAEVIAAIAGAIVGTISACGMVPDIWGLAGWFVSVVSMLRLLSVSRHRTNPNSRRPSIIARVAIASLAIFFLLVLTAMLTACAANPNACGPIERASAPIFLILGTICVAIAIRWTWK